MTKFDQPIGEQAPSYFSPKYLKMSAGQTVYGIKISSGHKIVQGPVTKSGTRKSRPAINITYKDRLYEMNLTDDNARLLRTKLDANDSDKWIGHLFDAQVIDHDTGLGWQILADSIK